MPLFNPYRADEEAVKQKLEFAKLLRQGGLTEDQGQMVSGHYVKPALTQGLARLLKIGLGAKEMKDAISQQGTMDASRQAAITSALGGYAQNQDPSALLSNPDTMEYGLKALGSRAKSDYDARLRGPVTRDVKMGAETVTQQLDPTTQEWSEVGRGDSFAPKSPPSHLLEYQAVHPEDPEMKGYDAWRKTVGAGQGASPYYQFLPGANGYLVGNTRSGEINPGMVNGQPAIPGALSPELQGALSYNKAGGKVSGETQAQAAIDLPTIEAQAKYSTELLDKLKDHPGLSAAVGVPGITNYLPGTEAADFKAVLNQIKGGQFLEAYKGLKGGGAITEVEGKKAEQAIARMDTAQTEKSFKESAEEFKTIITNGMNRARRRAQGAYAGPERRAPSDIVKYDAQGNIIP